jgi:hypothetical protein
MTLSSDKATSTSPAAPPFPIMTSARWLLNRYFPRLPARRYTTLERAFGQYLRHEECDHPLTSGDKGILRYRGYAIEDVAANSTYLEVAWLLIYGQLPPPRNSRGSRGLRRHTPQKTPTVPFDALPHNAHPMSAFAERGVGLSTSRRLAQVHDLNRSNSTIRLLAGC